MKIVTPDISVRLSIAFTVSALLFLTLNIKLIVLMCAGYAAMYFTGMAKSIVSDIPLETEDGNIKRYLTFLLLPKCVEGTWTIFEYVAVQEDSEGTRYTKK